MKGGFLVLASLVLPCCTRWSEDEPGWLYVVVDNQGTVSADFQGTAHYRLFGDDWDEGQALAVPPAQSMTFAFDFDNLDYIRVSIHRSTDGLSLFEGSWDRHYLVTQDGVVTITVWP